MSPEFYFSLIIFIQLILIQYLTGFATNTAGHIHGVTLGTLSKIFVANVILPTLKK